MTMAGGQAVNAANITTTANTFTIVRGAAGLWTTSGTITAAVNFSLTFTGAQNMTCNRLVVQVGGTFTFPSNQTLTSTVAPLINGATYATTTVKSGTASTSFTLAAPAGTQSDYATYTDVIANGNTIYNYRGGTLTRTTNITNFSTTPEDSTDPGVANVKSGTTYKINGSSLTGTRQTLSTSAFQG